jgi:hypothetical protein
VIDLIKEIGAIDLTLIAFYAIAIRYTARAVVPSIAFMLTIALSFADMPQDLLHACYAGIYLVLLLLSKTSILNGMLAYAVVNALALFYFLSSLWFEYFTLYFAATIVVVNLYIIFTIFKGTKNGQLGNVDRIVLFSAVDLCNVQTHSKTETRR